VHIDASHTSFPFSLDNSLYSKFASDETLYDDPIPGKQGMLIVYLPAALLGLYMYAASSQQNAAALLLFLHFGKRVAEVLFLHKFGGVMSKKMGIFIGMYYSFDTLLVASYALPVSEVSPIFLKAGIVLFGIGQAGNLYHHYLLATLRKDGAKEKEGRRYVPPKGGLFSLVAAPHYFFELVSWLGIACAAQQLNAFLEVLSHTSYLMGRAYNTSQKYFREFNEKEWPKTRKNIFPFLY